jgi:hypothetical protein
MRKGMNDVRTTIMRIADLLIKMAESGNQCGLRRWRHPTRIDFEKRMSAS